MKVGDKVWFFVKDGLRSGQIMSVHRGYNQWSRLEGLTSPFEKFKVVGGDLCQYYTKKQLFRSKKKALKFLKG